MVSSLVRSFILALAVVASPAMATETSLQKEQQLYADPQKGPTALVNGPYKFGLTHDGELFLSGMCDTLYIADGGSSKVVAKMQSDGNFVLYNLDMGNQNPVVKYASDTHGNHDAKLTLKDDGSVKITATNGDVLKTYHADNSCSATVLSEGTTHTIQLGSSDMITTLKDNGTAGLGDVFTWDRSNKIYKTDDPSMISQATPLGDNQGHCIRLTNDGDNSEYDCLFTIFFSDGTITAHGPFNAGTTIVAITGGTGAYHGALGSMELSFAGIHNEDGTVNPNGAFFSYNYIFHLTLSSKKYM